MPVTIETYAAMGIEILVYSLTEHAACLISPDDTLDRAAPPAEFFFTGFAWSTKRRRLRTGQAGEVLVKDYIMVGYLNREDATAKSIVDGWLPGDVAVMDSDGFVYIQDNVKDMIISRRERVPSRDRARSSAWKA